MHLTTILSALVAASGILAASTSLELGARAVVNHDSLNPIRTPMQPTKLENGGPINRDATSRQNTAKTPHFRISANADLIQHFTA
ncbi:hypothetical protein BM1_10144 [Bipolaris maydis]|uniref:uncharacterized protein n=1 Tax=Cochliobolus heterostrophus TaxID=5016 RepID=UPI0024DC3226|nr:hypothetical protein BM1_10144 [Bipolaris maydis]KAJ5021999.1 hypothetical protein J3E73DRAFT_401548 [Bipolaris maydis]KAJ6272504.1 hypothetical protein PSV08DRAFT_389060 [Bipolaris maydis]KAJ6281407.1 hypothetical protein J3E71DRAFT_380461 [Bipolaris maydis]